MDGHGLSVFTRLDEEREREKKKKGLLLSAPTELRTHGGLRQLRHGKLGVLHTVRRSIGVHNADVEDAVKVDGDVV